jgi:hypothetical protein
VLPTVETSSTGGSRRGACSASGTLSKLSLGPSPAYLPGPENAILGG